MLVSSHGGTERDGDTENYFSGDGGTGKNACRKALVGNSL